MPNAPAYGFVYSADGALACDAATAPRAAHHGARPGDARRWRRQCDGLTGLLWATKLAGAMGGVASPFDTVGRLRQRRFASGRWLRTPARVLGMAWYRFKDALA